MVLILVACLACHFNGDYSGCMCSTECVVSLACSPAARRPCHSPRGRWRCCCGNEAQLRDSNHSVSRPKNRRQRRKDMTSGHMRGPHAQLAHLVMLVVWSRDGHLACHAPVGKQGGVPKVIVKVATLLGSGRLGCFKGLFHTINTWL